MEMAARAVEHAPTMRKMLLAMLQYDEVAGSGEEMYSQLADTRTQKNKKLRDLPE